LGNPGVKNKKYSIKITDVLGKESKKWADI
jgi:flagellar motor switch protein FliM